MQAATQRGEDLGLNEDEICFYDALAMNESAVQAMGNDELKVIAAELVTNVRQSATIDWTVRESARAKIRVMVRRILKKHGYPPDLQDEATKLVLSIDSQKDSYEYELSRSYGWACETMPAGIASSAVSICCHGWARSTVSHRIECS